MAYFDEALKAERQADIETAVEQLVDMATERHTHVGGDGESETFLECHVCGEWEGHKEGCFIPALLAWQNAPLPSPAK